MFVLETVLEMLGLAGEVMREGYPVIADVPDGVLP